MANHSCPFATERGFHSFQKSKTQFWPHPISQSSTAKSCQESWVGCQQNNCPPCWWSHLLFAATQIAAVLLFTLLDKLFCHHIPVASDSSIFHCCVHRPPTSMLLLDKLFCHYVPVIANVMTTLIFIMLETRNYRNCHECVEGWADRNNKKECMQPRDNENDQDQSSHNIYNSASMH